MESSADLRAQLQSLSIARESRPASRSARRGGRRAASLLLRLTALACLIAGGVFVWLRYGAALAAVVMPHEKPAAIKTLTVTTQPAPAPAPVHTATGKIVSDHRVQVATKVSGQIVALMYEQGDRVSQGQVLARIEDVNYRARRDEAAAMLDKAKAQLEFDRYNRERLEEMARYDQSTNVELAQARRDYDASVAQVAASAASLAWAEKALRDCEVVAPIAGVILQRNVEVGDFVAAEGGLGANANAQFATIADMAKLRVEVDVSELDIARLRADMPCLITPDAYKDRHYRGHVLWIDPGANYSKATVQVKVRIDAPDENLRVEGSAQVAFFAEDPAAPAGQSDSGVWIPAAALRDIHLDAGDVFRVENGVLRKASVRLGRKRGSAYEVIGGLPVGTVIVASNPEKCSEGQALESR